ncbi:MAG: hypothetical protein RIQ88_385 [Actinomycetota bacterium]|jgi:hypothetical protein
MTTKTWWFIDRYVNPEATIKAIDKEYGKITSSPVFYGYWTKVAIYRVALKDVQDNLHSLLEDKTCSCGLTVSSNDLMAIVETPHHRNHTTLEHDPNPQFRGLVGRRITRALQPLNVISEVDLKWDRISQNLKEGGHKYA